MGFRVEGWFLVVAAVAAVTLVLVGNALVPAPRNMAMPTASELVQLEPYLTPVAVDADAQVGVPPRVTIDGNPFGPAAAPRAGPGEQGPAREPAPRWAVTAIMITGDRGMAIVNDRLVRPGDRLEDGARIADVQRDHVVLITPSGERRRLELER